MCEPVCFGNNVVLCQFGTICIKPKDGVHSTGVNHAKNPDVVSRRSTTIKL